MSKMINFGIDLGTTNSLIAKFDNGTVEVFKNPVGFKETLPSVVGFRKGSILVGERAKGFLEKDSKNVFGRFKRDMGTTTSFRIHSLGQSKTPVELSAFVLKELKGFIHTGEVPQAAVITIPASFDMVQSNATKQAGLEAGFKQVILLQEPIAASLGYANKEKNRDLKNSRWFVYDLGGGTFDVALVKIVEGEMKIVDHEGNNYLGGMDFDALIVERLIVPQLERKGQFTDLLGQMKSETGRYNGLWYGLLMKAEDAKIELSSRTSAEIEVTVTDEDDNEIDAVINITRSEFESLIKDSVDSTAQMLKNILTRNSLQPGDIEFVLMVGGSTYIPFVRKRIEELLGKPINTGIDPTNAIAVGAAFYAASKELSLGEAEVNKSAAKDTLQIRATYNRASQDSEEYFRAKTEGDVSGLYYRIIRNDGGYDSGLKPLKPSIEEDLPLLAEAYNSFSFKVYDSKSNPVRANLETIQIAHGGFNPQGQPLPDDLSLVWDDIPNADTRLELIFARNTILPLRCRKTAEVTKTLIHGTDDDIKIRVLEGPSDSHESANKFRGQLVISAKDLKRDIYRGTEIELEFALSESLDLSVKAYVTSTDQEFADVFRPALHNVPVDVLREQIEDLESRIEEEQAEAIEDEKYEVAKDLKDLLGPITTTRRAAEKLGDDDVTHDRFKLENEKRKIAQQLWHLTKDKRIARLRCEYQEAKTEATDTINQSGNDSERRQLNEIIAQEQVFMNSANPQKIEEQIAQLHRLEFGILLRTPDFVVGWFHHLTEKRERFNDQIQAKNLIEAGKRHVATEDCEKLVEVIFRLRDLLPQTERDSSDMETRRAIMGIKLAA